MHRWVGSTRSDLGFGYESKELGAATIAARWPGDLDRDHVAFDEFPQMNAGHRTRRRGGQSAFLGGRESSVTSG
jgi:hypothetical protein